MLENSGTKVVYSLSLEVIGIITGIVLCILQGTNVIDIGWFWAIFPFWIVFAVEIAIVLLVLLIIGIVFVITKLIER